METALGCLFDFLTRRYPAIEEVSKAEREGTGTERLRRQTIDLYAWFQDIFGKAEREGEAEKRRRRLELSGEFLEC
jgi:hypothetical protein